MKGMAKTVAQTVGGIAVVAVLIVLARLISPYYVGTVFARALDGSTPFLLGLLAPLAIGGALLFGAALLSESPSASAHKASGVLGVFAVLATLAMLGPIWKIPGYEGGLRKMNRSGYEALHTYGANMDVVNGQRPEYAHRLNLPEAKLNIERNLEGNVGNMSMPTRVVTGNGAAWCVTLEREYNDWSTHTTGVVCQDEETGKVTSANFDAKKVGSSNGSFGSFLRRTIAKLDAGTVYQDRDVYGFIEDGKARLAVPVTKKAGSNWAPHEVPAGVVVFDEHGTPVWHKSVKAGQIPGPVMPTSIAEKVRESVLAQHGYLKFKKPAQNDLALQDTSHVGSVAAADPNAENATEWVLTRTDGTPVYVTPLTPMGSSRNVAAYLEVTSDTVEFGQMPKATLYRLDEAEAATQAIAQAIVTLYDADIDWAENNDGGEDKNKSRLYEITPTKPGVMVATVGAGSRALYRVEVVSTLDENNQPGQVCVYRFSGQTPTKPIRCDSATGEPTPVGALRGLAGASTGTPSGAPVEAGELDKFTTEQLIAELYRRTNGAAATQQ